jgi:hypothetical protein
MDYSDPPSRGIRMGEGFQRRVRVAFKRRCGGFESCYAIYLGTLSAILVAA